jgi:hypothetical protein
MPDDGTVKLAQTLRGHIKRVALNRFVAEWAIEILVLRAASSMSAHCPKHVRRELARGASFHRDL